MKSVGYYGPTFLVEELFKGGKIGETVRELEARRQEYLKQVEEAQKKLGEEARSQAGRGLVKVKTVSGEEAYVSPEDAEQIAKDIPLMVTPMEIREGKLTYQVKQPQPEAEKPSYLWMPSPDSALAQEGLLEQMNKKAKEVEEALQNLPEFYSSPLHATKTNLLVTDPRKVKAAEDYTKALLGFTAPVRGLIPEAEWEKPKFKIEEKILPLASTHSTRVSPPPTKPYPTLKFPEAPTVSGALIESVIEPSGSPVLHQKIPVGTVTMPSSKAREHLEKVSPRPISTTRYLFENPSYFAGAFIGEALTAFGIGEAIGRGAGYLKNLLKGPNIEDVAAVARATSRWGLREFKPFESGWGKGKPTTSTFEVGGEEFYSRYMVDLGPGGYSGGAAGTVTEQFTYIIKPPNLATSTSKWTMKSFKPFVKPQPAKPATIELPKPLPSQSPTLNQAKLIASTTTITSRIVGDLVKPKSKPVGKPDLEKLVKEAFGPKVEFPGVKRGEDLWSRITRTYYPVSFEEPKTDFSLQLRPGSIGSIKEKNLKKIINVTRTRQALKPEKTLKHLQLSHEKTLQLEEEILKPASKEIEKLTPNIEKITRKIAGISQKQKSREKTFEKILQQTVTLNFKPPNLTFKPPTRHLTPPRPSLKPSKERKKSPKTPRLPKIKLPTIKNLEPKPKHKRKRKKWKYKLVLNPVKILEIASPIKPEKALKKLLKI